jgi:hypothetical protein
MAGSGHSHRNRTLLNQLLTLQHMLSAQSIMCTHRPRCTISMPKANDPSKVVGEAKSSKHQKMKPARTAAKEKAKHHPSHSFRDSGNTSIPLSTLVKLTIYTSFMNTNVFRKMMSNLPKKNWKPFRGQQLQRKTPRALPKYWKPYATRISTHNRMYMRCIKRGRDGTHQYYYVDYNGFKVNAEHVNSAFLYTLLPQREIQKYGDYWAILRRRPGTTALTIPEYMPNKQHRYKEVLRDFKRAGLTLAPSRYWMEVPLNQFKVEFTYPYFSYFKGNKVNVRRSTQTPT